MPAPRVAVTSINKTGFTDFTIISPFLALLGFLFYHQGNDIDNNRKDNQNPCDDDILLLLHIHLPFDTMKP